MNKCVEFSVKLDACRELRMKLAKKYGLRSNLVVGGITNDINKQKRWYFFNEKRLINNDNAYDKHIQVLNKWLRTDRRLWHELELEKTKTR